MKSEIFFNGFYPTLSQAGPVARIGGGEVHTAFWWGNSRKKDDLVNQSVDWRMILKMIYKKCDGDVDCIDMAQDRDRCRALVNAVMNFRIPLNVGNFLTS